MKIKLIFTLLVVTLVVLEGVNIYLSNTVAGSSIEVARLRETIEVLDEKNISLKSEYLSYSSYDHVSSRAAELGFQESKDSAIMLKAPLQVAISR